MAEYAALHNVSLLLVGTNIQVSRSGSTDSNKSSEEDADSQSSDPMPDDEMLDCHQNKIVTDEVQEESIGIETIMQPKQENGVLVLVDENSSTPDEARWRAHGLARRRKILDEDKRNGGREFSLSFDCSVQRYFSVAHWALEQFHKLYQSSSSINDEHQLEEIYVMGFRIVSFLSKCLPKHPGFSSSPLIQKRSKSELDLLWKCLEDVALRIDEFVCNQFVDDGDLFLDSTIAAEMENEDSDGEETPTKSRVVNTGKFNTSTNFRVVEQTENWVNFDEFQNLEQKSAEGSSTEQIERKLSESPTSETVGTAGTESVEPLDSSDAKSNSSANSHSDTEKCVRQIPNRESVFTLKEEYESYYFDDDSRVIRDDNFDMDELSEMDESLKSYSSKPFTLLRKSVSLNFLKTIACEPVLFETDSDAADSWANTEVNTISPNSKKSRPCLPSSSGVTPTSDPARIAFRDLMSKLPHKSILQRNNKPRLSDHRSSSSSLSNNSSLSKRRKVRNIEKVISIDDDCLDEVVDIEIQEYLDKKLGKLDRKNGKPRKPRTRRRSRRKEQRQETSISSDRSSSSCSASSDSETPSSSYTSLTSLRKTSSLRRSKGSETSAFTSFRKTKPKQKQERQPQEKPVAPKSVEVDDDWISFSGRRYF